MTTIATSRDKDTENYGKFVRRAHKGWEKRAIAEDPWAAAEMFRAAADLEEAAVRVVGRLRELGYSWVEIGQELGISDVTAHKRYAKRIKPPAEDGQS